MDVDVGRAYRGFDDGLARLVVRVLLPVLAATTLVVVLVRTRLLADATGAIVLVLYAVPALAAAVILLYPLLLAQSRRADIDRAIHLFVTHMAVLATSNTPPTVILQQLGRKPEYGALAEESRRIHTLVTAWHMSLSEACRVVSRRTPSRILSDFLDRFAYSLESGEKLEDFLQSEQVVVTEAFSAQYRGHLYDLEGMKHLFASMVMSIVFLVVFALFVPILTGVDALLVLGIAGALVLVNEVAFVIMTKSRAPHDPVWYEGDLPCDARRALARSLPVSVLGVLVAGALALTFLPHAPPGILMALTVTPLLYSGVRALTEEERVLRRDHNHPAFIRSLGASVTARGGNVLDALKQLKHHDFGPLTLDVRALHQRLSLRVDGERAWAYYGADTASRVIEHASRVFVEGVRAGGRADAIGRILSENAVRVLGLRQERAQVARTFRGLLAGLVAGVGFSLFVALGILGMLQRVFDRVNESVDVATLLGGAFTARVDLAALDVGMAVALLVHAAASAIMLHHARGGHPFRALVEFTAFAWIAGVVGVLSTLAIAHLG